MAPFISATPILIEDIRPDDTWPGITNDSKNPCVDTFRSTTLTMLKRFGVPSEGLELKIESRGSPPQGGGEVILGLLFLLCALCPQDVSKFRVGKPSPCAIETLRHIRDFLGVKFVIKLDLAKETVILKCVDAG
ncbi:hypothetical protein HHK36_014526 [Tetracentron sinense]|uniref:RNA 3'-terminal phosphate cyclase domain-containing protein n=1 Tax=Tetracentron sinense TaxID=13715 RepID=A0A835DD01_TETSI|nr:hypothetical protein HHK36_014526 [Tetracentron sinense]